jgi:predicted helicase
MIYSNLLKKHYSDWPSLEKAIEALPTAKARGNVFEEFTFAYFTIKKQMYQIAEIYPSADIPDKYRKAFKLGNKQHQDSGVDGLIITNEGKLLTSVNSAPAELNQPTKNSPNSGLTAVIATIVVQLPILLQ